MSKHEPVGVINALYPRGTNSTHFTACCNTAICDDQERCPKCKMLIVGWDEPNAHSRGRARWRYATQHWNRTA